MSVETKLSTLSTPEEGYLPVVGKYRRKYHDGRGLYFALTDGKPMKVVRPLSICTFLLSFVAAVGALNPNRDIHQLARRSWGEKDGYHGRAEALAQITDGFQWIGTDNGLFRFDDLQFERYVPRSGDKLSEGPVRWRERLVSSTSIFCAGSVLSEIQQPGSVSRPFQ